jgi:nucleoside-diphosphate-sugar epimerase
LERAVSGVEAVYHLAGSISLEMNTRSKMIETNTMGTRNVVSACLKYGVRRLVFFSSIDALRNDTPGKWIDENQPLIDVDWSDSQFDHIPPYDLSKALAEREVITGIKHGLDAVILRPSAMLGPFDFKPSYLGQAIIQLAEGKIPALVKGGFDWVDVRDVVTGAILAEEVAYPGSIYMLGGNWHSIKEVAKIVSSITHRAAPLVTVPMWLADAFAPIMLKLARFNGSHPIYTRVTLSALRSNRRVLSSRAQHELGYSVRPLTETIQDTIAWFNENNYLDRDYP